MCVRQRVVTRLRAKSAVYISRSRAPMTVATSGIRINTYVPFLLLFAVQIEISYALGSLITPALIGNVIGGTGLFALLAYAQVRQEL